MDCLVYFQSNQRNRVANTVNTVRPAKPAKDVHHDHSLQLRKVVEKLEPVGKFHCNLFRVRTQRRLGAGSFGNVFAAEIGTVRCVVKYAKKYATDELVLEGRILSKLWAEPWGKSHKFFPILYGYDAVGGLVMSRFEGKTVKQMAASQEPNDWKERIKETSQAIDFMHERGVNILVNRLKMLFVLGCFEIVNLLI